MIQIAIMNLIFATYKILLNQKNEGKMLLTLFRMFWWKINQYFFHMPVIIQLNSKINCICYPESSYGSLIVYAIYPEYSEMSLLERYLKKSSTFIDIGAGFGDYSLLASSKIENGRIFAFEPLEIERKRFQQNIQLNNKEKIITLSSFAVSNKNGEAVFEKQKTNELSHLAHTQTKRKKKNQFSVKTTTIDSIVKKNSLKHIDCIKIDVEGAENLVLAGASKTLSAQIVDFFIIELNVNQLNFIDTKLVDFFEFIQSKKYSAFTIQNDKLFPITKYSYTETSNVIVIKDNSKIISKVKKCLKQ